MAAVKLDSPVKVFVASVAQDSLEQLATKVMYTDNLCISVSESSKYSIVEDPGTVDADRYQGKSTQRGKKWSRKVEEEARSPGKRLTEKNRCIILRSR